VYTLAGHPPRTRVHRWLTPLLFVSRHSGSQACRQRCAAHVCRLPSRGTRQAVRAVSRLNREKHETLCAYAAFIGEGAQYVVDAVIEKVIANDPAIESRR
jgi:hypothetical protein